jgi:hypothetical protein
MREHPWHLRRATTRHYQWFRNLLDFHGLTNAWLKDLEIDRPPHLLSRGINKQVAENLWMVDLLPERDLETLLDDTYPDDTLGRLEQAIWAVQAFTLSSLLDRASDATRKGAMMSILEQSSWKHGRECAKSRWPALVGRLDEDLRKIFQSLQDSPMSHYPHGSAFLLRRAIKAELQVELRACPHRSSFAEVRPVASELCRLHFHWMRGFAYALNSRVSIAQASSDQRCIHVWSFLT